MARIESHAVSAEREWVAPAEVIDAAARQVEASLIQHRLDVESGDDALLVPDPRLTSAALAHVLENAAQHSPTGSAISVSATARASEIWFVVRDRGAGLGTPATHRRLASVPAWGFPSLEACCRRKAGALGRERSGRRGRVHAGGAGREPNGVGAGAGATLRDPVRFLAGSSALIVRPTITTATTPITLCQRNATFVERGGPRD